MNASPDRSEADALSLKLRAATRAAHEALEATPFSRQLSDGTLDLPAYVRYLAAMWHFHSGLEDAASAAGDTAVRAVWREDMRRASAIEGDLKAVERANADGGVPFQPGLETGATSPFSELMADVRCDDRHLIGLLYVSEGSRLGGRVLRKALLSRYPGLADTGLAYLEGHGERTGQQWAAFRSRLDGLKLGADGRTAVVEGATAGFRAVQRVFAGF